MYYKIVFQENSKLKMENIFDGDKKVFTYNRGEIITGRIDPKDNGEVYLMLEDGYGCIVSHSIVEKI